MTDDEASGYLGLNIHAVLLLIGGNLDHLKFVMSLDLLSAISVFLKGKPGPLCLFSPDLEILSLLFTVSLKITE